jgi:hypothetical protein
VLDCSEIQIGIQDLIVAQELNPILGQRSAVLGLKINGL